jgi:hypothetical protein
LGEILNNREATGKIAKWTTELSIYDIVYRPRSATKAQALSDFVAEWTETQTPPKERELEYWTINFDGSLQLQGAGAGILVTSPEGESFKYVLQMHFQHLTMQSSTKYCFIVIPRSEKEGTKPPYVCPGCSNHTHGNNMINRCNVIKIMSNSLT